MILIYAGYFKRTYRKLMKFYIGEKICLQNSAIHGQNKINPKVAVAVTVIDSFRDSFRDSVQKTLWVRCCA